MVMPCLRALLISSKIPMSRKARAAWKLSGAKAIFWASNFAFTASMESFL